MRFRTATLPIIALLAMAAGSMIAEAAEKKKVATEVKAQYKKGTEDNPYVPVRDPAIKGIVEAKKSDCESGRRVKIKGVGKGKTNKKGKFRISDTKIGPGKYTVKVKKASLETGKKTLICKPAKDTVRVK